jgi:hypothetical protein
MNWGAAFDLVYQERAIAQVIMNGDLGRCTLHRHNSTTGHNQQ